MRTLVYKRTHNGDPDAAGRFGCMDCMGRVRAWPFDAVVGVGGTGDRPKAFGIARKLTWVGIGPHRSVAKTTGFLIVTFDHFLYFGPDGPLLETDSPRLAYRMYQGGARTVMEFTSEEQAEVGRILALTASAPPSAARTPATAVARRCRRAG